MYASILVVITDTVLDAEIANVTVTDTGQYTVDGLRSGATYSFELFVALEDLQLYGQNSSSVIGVTLLGKLEKTNSAIAVHVQGHRTWYSRYGHGFTVLCMC